MRAYAARLRPALAAVALTGGALIAGAALSAQDGTIVIHDAWVREPVSGRSEMVAFAVIENRGAVPRAIVGVSADIAEKAELHEMKMSGAMMLMLPVKRIDVPAHGRVELSSGGFHVMLFGVKDPRRAGDTIKLAFTVDDGTTVSVSAQVRKQEGM